MDRSENASELYVPGLLQERKGGENDVVPVGVVVNAKASRSRNVRSSVQYHVMSTFRR